MEKKEEVVVIRVTLQKQLDSGVVAFETWTPQDVTQDDLHGLMDKLHAASARVKAHQDLERERQFVYNDTSELERMEHDLKVMDTLSAERARLHAESGRRGEYQLSDGELKSRAGLEANIKTLRQRRAQHSDRADALQLELGL